MENDKDYSIPYKVIVDRPSADKDRDTHRATERYETRQEAMEVFKNTSGFCMVTHRNPIQSKIIAYRFKKTA